MHIEVYGSSSEGNAYSISDGTTRLLIECGIPFRELQIKTNFFDPMPEGCLISHSHGDHAKSVNDLMRLGIDCYMSDETAAEVDYDVRYRKWKPIEHNYKTQIGTFKVLPLQMAHDVRCLGFYIHSTKTMESLFFATDTCCIPYNLPPIDYIMVEANYDFDILNDRIMKGYIDPAMKNRLAMSHMEIGSTLLWLRKQDLTKTKRIYLLHLSYGSSNADDFKRRVMECTGVPVTIA